MRLIRVLTVLAVVLAMAQSPCEARARRTCTVTTESGSKYTLPVVFMSGREMNEASNSSATYSAIANYAVIVLEDDRIIILQLQSVMFSDPVTPENVSPGSTFRGKDKTGSSWGLEVLQ